VDLGYKVLGIKKLRSNLSRELTGKSALKNIISLNDRYGQVEEKCRRIV